VVEIHLRLFFEDGAIQLLPFLSCSAKSFPNHAARVREPFDPYGTEFSGKKLVPFARLATIVFFARSGLVVVAVCYRDNKSRILLRFRDGVTRTDPLSPPDQEKIAFPPDYDRWAALGELIPSLSLWPKDPAVDWDVEERDYLLSFGSSNVL